MDENDRETAEESRVVPCRRKRMQMTKQSVFMVVAETQAEGTQPANWGEELCAEDVHGSRQFIGRRPRDRIRKQTHIILTTGTQLS